MISTLAIAALVVALLLLAGMAYQRLGTARDLRRHPPPGRMIDIGGCRLHLLEKGKNHPTVVFESGLPGSVLSWSLVQEELSRLVRTVAYDRAGLGWSDPGPEPRSAESVTSELRLLLARAGVAPPYILVGHSFGGLTCRLYASRYPDEVAALVLLDPVGASEWFPLSEREKRRLEAGAKLCRRTALLARFGVTRLVGLLARIGAVRMAKMAVRWISAGQMADAGSAVSPLTKLPAGERSIVRTFWVQAKFYEAMAGQIAALPESAAQMARAGDRLEAKPVVVISARNTAPGRLAEQLSIVRLSSRGRHLVAHSSGHWIQLDDPELVTGIILEVIAELGRPSGRGSGSPASSLVH
ncbi:MAG TPA: alpha/beta fold hydrolase [Patescibacteria group bacterium]|nr:alpha/beta fold hydrolase [Patescibacteria group bacterium]